MDDSKIIELFFERSETAILELKNQYGAYLNTAALRILRSPDDAEEVVNDAYLAAWNQIPPEKPRSLRLYLARIVRNLALKKREHAAAAKRSPEVAGTLDELAECIPDTLQNVEDTVEDKALGEEINRWLDERSKEEQAIFVSRYFYELTLREIAEKYGLPERRVKYLLRVMRNALKERLSRKGWRS